MYMQGVMHISNQQFQAEIMHFFSIMYQFFLKYADIAQVLMLAYLFPSFAWEQHGTNLANKLNLILFYTEIQKQGIQHQSGGTCDPRCFVK